MPTIHSSHRRDKKKKSCQRLGLFKVAALSKKKLQSKIKQLNEKLKAKVTGKVLVWDVFMRDLFALTLTLPGKAELQAELNEAKEDAAFWEDMHVKAEELITGRTYWSRSIVFRSA